MADDEIAVMIDDEPHTPADVGPKTAPEEPVDDLKSQLADLKAARERDAARAASAERAAALERSRAQQALSQVETVRKEATAREGESVEAGITAANEAIAAAKRDFKAAGEAGNYDAQADAQERLSAATARRERLTEQKADIGIRQAEAARPRPMQVQTQQEAPTDETEAMLSQMAAQGAPRSADWLRQHRDFLTDRKKNSQVRSAHFAAEAEGIAPESDEYFRFIEERVGLRETEKPAPKAEVRTHSRRPPVAPVAQSGGGMNGSGTTVRLTKSQADAATDGTLVWNYDDPSGKGRFKKGDPIGVQEMARRVLEQTKQGLYNPNNINA